jgi:hypothetical protein
VPTDRKQCSTTKAKINTEKKNKNKTRKQKTKPMLNEEGGGHARGTMSLSLERG